MLKDIVGQNVGVFAREFKKLPMNCKDYNSYINTRKVRRLRKDTTTIIEHCQYLGDDKKKQSIMWMVERITLSRKQQDLSHENILKTNEAGKSKLV